MSAEDYIFEDPCESRERCMMDDSYQYNDKPAPFNPKFYSKKKKERATPNLKYKTKRYLHIIRQTENAVLFQFEGIRSWIPRSISFINPVERSVRYRAWFTPRDERTWRENNGG